jgi:hypothetical protein
VPQRRGERSKADDERLRAPANHPRIESRNPAKRAESGWVPFMSMRTLGSSQRRGSMYRGRKDELVSETSTCRSGGAAMGLVVAVMDAVAEPDALAVGYADRVELDVGNADAEAVADADMVGAALGVAVAVGSGRHVTLRSRLLTASVRMSVPSAVKTKASSFAKRLAPYVARYP